jgi:hypothetical protein
MFDQTWHHGLIRKYVVLFGTLFNNIYINREAADGTHLQTIKVPLTYGPKDKFLSRVNNDPGMDKAVAISLPIMAFEMTTLEYAAERKLNTINKMVAVGTSPNKVKFQYGPVPYDINFTLSVMVKNVEDGTRIIEQILPYFTPEWTASVRVIPEMNIVHDIPLILNSTSVEDSYAGEYTQRRALTYTLDFTMKAYIYGPVKAPGAAIVKTATGDMFGSIVANDSIATVDVTPGLDSQGNPINYYGRLANTGTIDINTIDANDNYGFVNTITEDN